MGIAIKESLRGALIGKDKRGILVESIESIIDETFITNVSNPPIQNPRESPKKDHNEGILHLR